MTFQVTFKTPDVLDAVEEFGADEARRRTEHSSPPPDSDHVEELASYWADKARGFANQFVRHGEYITVEFDLANQTVKVLPAGR